MNTEARDQDVVNQEKNSEAMKAAEEMLHEAIQKGKDAQWQPAQEEVEEKTEETPVEEAPKQFTGGPSKEAGYEEVDFDELPDDVRQRFQSRFNYLYKRLKDAERDRATWGQNLVAENETIKQQLTELKVAQEKAVIEAEKQHLQGMVTQALQAAARGDEATRIKMVQEISRREAALSLREKQVTPEVKPEVKAEPGKREVAPDDAIFLRKLASDNGTTWNPQSAPAKQLDAMWNDPRYSKWSVKQMVEFIETGFKQKTTPKQEPVEETREKKFAQSVLGGNGQSSSPRTVSDSKTPALTEAQKVVARRMFNNVPAAEAYKRYSKGL